MINKSNGKRKVVAVIMGTRPEAIKLSPVVQILKERTDLFQPKVIVTAQHREMMDQVLSVFNIEPDYDLNIMRKNQTLHQITTGILSKIRRIFMEISPSVALVQGDTTTTFAAALAAFYDKVPVGHIEAGLRTYNRYYPFPEEMNRKLVSSLATFHFAPTQRAAEALQREGIDKRNIFTTGNTVVDALQQVARHGAGKFSVSFPPKNDKIVLVTAHRRENLNEGLRRICQAVKILLKADKDVFIVFPMHLNPKVQEVVRKKLGCLKRVVLCEPLDYCSFIGLMRRSRLILTDSGGIQEEAPSMGVPVVVLRNETERLEAMESGLTAIAGLNPQKIVKESLRFLRQNARNGAGHKNPYGDGRSSQRIISILSQLIKNKRIT